ncbi:Ferroporti-1 [Plectosphaerella plurivora]|uniref:Solute carrier family 40 member n=1 Tax=Plectosphaerella plurivora TaxID=936078 RepID=A0A9P8VGX9_9PEZI|nr:Ferroporti-1 [Plectosphaerella plurivora]
MSAFKIFRASIPSRIARRLYLSHFLSTWNSRVFEFGAVLYLAAIFPGTLLPMSVYALARGLSAILFAPAVGRFIDTVDRLHVVRVSIVLQRLVVAASCVVFYLLAAHVPLQRFVRAALLALLVVFACVEKICSVMNTVSVEKDWVVVVAHNDMSSLAALNSQMRRIDLLCKLFGPLFIALIDGFSTKAAIIVNFSMNLASVTFEYFAIARVYHEDADLQEPKGQPADEPHHESSPSSDQPRGPSLATKFVTDFAFFFRHRVFLPSFAGSLLYLTVLNFSGQMVTFLIANGYNTTGIGAARTVSVVFEVSATWIAPWLMSRIGPVRAGLWMSTWQVMSLAVGTTIFFAFPDNTLLSTTALVGGTIVSRLGLWGFDLCTQVIVQEEVEAESRGAFASVEAAWQNAFEILSYLSTIIFFHPSDFKWPALISVAAVGLASVLYTTFVYLRRGHLLHLDALTKFLRTSKGKQRARDRGIDRVATVSEF